MLDRIEASNPSPVDLPESLAALGRLAYNLYWSWHPEVQALFSRIDEAKWAGGAGPVRILREAQNLPALAKDRAYLKNLKEAAEQFDAYMAATETWHSRRSSGDDLVAYFCAEFGFHESISLYCGGLGILAGDHCKEASDLGLPFVAVGMLYRRGFFHQLIDPDGRQNHLFPVVDPKDLPIERVLLPGTKKLLTVEIELPDRKVHAAVWRIAVGRVPVLLLDTDLPQNSPEDRPITSQLYTRGRDMRLHQEIVLGIGGVRALHALGIAPTVWHLNEGHSAFLLLERLNMLVKKGGTLEDAQQKIKQNSLITVHTPIPAGNERFDAKAVSAIIEPTLKKSEIKLEAILKLGLDVHKDASAFDMSAFAMRLTRAANGVSLLHGRTADSTWRKISGYKVIGITNGVHMPTWLGPKMKALYEELGASFEPETKLQLTESRTRPTWEPVVQADPKALWEAHRQQKLALIQFAIQRLFDQHSRHGEGPSELRNLANLFDPDALLIGFARRFATYKRAALLFSNERRLAKLLDAKGRKVQIVFAGKAHHMDREGQKLIEQVYQKTQSPRFKGKVFFLEEYDMQVGRMLVQGVDLWLNNPRRPMEASGTSGMKAAANGVPNASILDGWWDEAYDKGKATRNGFAVDGRKELRDEKAQDKHDALQLYHTLEEEVVPAFFSRDENGLPLKWIEIMKHSIAESLYAFSTARMIEEYVDQMYSPRG